MEEPLSLEQREIRPFQSIEELDQFFEEMVLIVGDQAISPGAGLRLDEDEYLRCGVQLQLANDRSKLTDLHRTLSKKRGGSPLNALGLTLEDLELVVIARSSYLRIVDIVDRRSLAEVLNGESLVDVSGSPRRDSLRSPRAGCEITAMVCLARSLPPGPLRPWRAGTWLSQTRFMLSAASSFSGFTPRPMDAAKKSELKLPPTTARYITMGLASPIDDSVDEDSLQMYVDVELVALMSAMPRSRASKALQQQLFVDSITAVVRAAKDNRADGVPELDACTWSDIKETLLGRIVTALAPKSADPSTQARGCSGLLDLLRSDPARFIARAEAVSGLLGSFNALLED
jgi:hypothetical protein